MAGFIIIAKKYLLYNDPLIGTFDSVVKEDTAERFAQAEIYMEQAAYMDVWRTCSIISAMHSVKA